MKVEAECAPCILHRGYSESKEATNDPSVQLEAMTALIGLLAQKFKPTAVPAYLGTERDRLVRKITGNPDPYSRMKRLSNQKALEAVPTAKRLILNEVSSKSRFRKACLCAIVGNIIEFDIPNHTFRFEELGELIKKAEADLTIDEIPRIFSMAERVKTILYLTDNAGEIVFDTLFIDELRRIGASVTVAVKGKPILNDATMEDAKTAGMHEIADQVISTGADSVGLIPSECSEEFLALYNSADMVIAKGMGYAETLTELDLRSPHALLLRTKCNPVANFFKVSRGKNVAKLSVGKWK